MSEPAGALVLLALEPTFAAFAKPSGLLVHRGWGDADVTAVELARRAVGPVFPVHRLDRGTSGVLLFARSSAAARALHQSFEDGDVDKRYLALVRGEPPASATVDHPLPRREDGPRVPARTHVRRLWAGDVDLASLGVADDPRLRPTQRYAWVEARPETGRPHQVRRHLKHLGHPVLGDANHGRGEHNRALAKGVGLTRLALHACSLAFSVEDEHGHRRLTVCCPIPPDLDGPLRRLGVSFPAAES